MYGTSAKLARSLRARRISSSSTTKPVSRVSSRASNELPGRLQAIACDARLTHKERRAIIAALGAEMDRTAPEGQSAATSITAFERAYQANAQVVTVLDRLTGVAINIIGGGSSAKI